MPAPLPVFKIISGAFVFLWENKKRVLRALLVPVAVLFTIEISPLIINFAAYLEKIPFFLAILFSLGSSVIYYAAYVLFAITCHRLVLMKNTSVPAYGMFSWTRREWWFLAYLIILPLVYFLSVALFLMAKGLLMEFDIKIESFQMLFAKGDGMVLLILLVALPSVYIFSKFSLLLPATAVDRDVDVDWAWKTSRKNGWRLIIIIVLLPLVFGLLQGGLILMGTIWPENTISMLIESSTYLLVYLILLAIQIVALSLSYKHLTENEVIEVKEEATTA